MFKNAGKRGSSRLCSSHQINKKNVQTYEESAESDDDIPLLSLEEQKALPENRSAKSTYQKKRTRTKAASSSRIKPKTNHSPPTVVKPPPQPVAKKGRSRRKQ